MYLDLYFALNEPNSKHFAHNFIVLVPSGLKSSIVPSLKTIEKFNPAWILPEPAASNIKSLLKFEVLDQPKSAKKSNKARNPNAQKVNQYIADPELKGLVLVVNAEKVILDRLELTNQLEVIEKTDDERDKQANELRNLIGKIPNLQILIDEVHHAATDDIKLRQVVNRWYDKGSITTVMGFSGTPYLADADKVPINENTALRFSQITNTVYYFPLLNAIRDFLKKPTVKEAVNVEPLEIIRQGIKHFYELYQNKTYGNGTIAKLAIYCGTIDRLEKEIFPFVAQMISQFGDGEDRVLKYHKGNKQFKLPKENDREYSSLDLSISRKRIILLVQVGKEGWDCKSLTGVILSQRGDCPKNMVLQTSCRCLRQVDKGIKETAIIWLNQQNAIALNEQLAEEQNTSIAEINRLSDDKGIPTIERFARTEFLQLPAVDFYQMQIDYSITTQENDAQTEAKLKTLSENLDNYVHAETIRTTKNLQDVQDVQVLGKYGTRMAAFDEWLLEIAKESLGYVPYDKLIEHENVLRTIFEKITLEVKEKRLFIEQFAQDSICSAIRVAYGIKRDVETKEEVIPKKAELLLVDKLTPTVKNDNLYPLENDVASILDADKIGKTTEELEHDIEEANRLLKETLEKQGLGSMFHPQSISFAVASKNSTFHYLPYNFIQSAFERDVLVETLRLQDFKQRKLEIYYNGERGLTGFVIQCFAKEGRYWSSVGKYTPDFLLIQRKKKSLHKIMIIETKGQVYALDKTYQKKSKYVSSDFLRLNEEKFGYKRFDFLQLSDADKPQIAATQLNERLIEFFSE